MTRLCLWSSIAAMPPVLQPDQGDTSVTPAGPPDSSSSAAVRELVAVLRVDRLGSDQEPVGRVTILSRGDVVGRYVVLSHLGHGGMGVVYAAYDPELDRKVALKLLLPQRAGGLDDAGRARLLREAQALARLAHPNVVAVYDAGMHDARVWIAMEFVAGQTLGAWAKEKPREWPKILLVLTDVARGVAAAHAAGLVHRDLKPDNVMIDGKGRVRVMDFGLAHGRAPVEDQELGSTLQFDVESQPETAALALRLTQAGALNGTPAYMAPGWSVMAWELLFGERPYTGDTLDELAAKVVSGRRQPPPRGRRVPGWLRRMVERGLVPQPSLRWPTMAVLLTALERGRTRARVKTAAVVLMGVAVIGAGAEGYRRWAEAQQVAVCEADGASIAEVWNEEVQAKLRDGLLATGVSYAETTAERVMPYFGSQAEALREARTEACLDTRVRRKWDEDTLGRSVWCLDERRIELEALIAEFSRADATSVQDAVLAAANLSQVGPCQDAHRLGRLPPLPEDLESVQAVLGTLSRAVARRAAGKYEEGLDVAQEALAAAEKLGWPPLTATARFRTGDLLDSSGMYPEAAATLENAYFQAAKVGALEVAANAASALTFTVGSRQARHDEGFRWSRHADVVLSILDVGEESLRRAEALSNLGLVHESKGEYTEAKAIHERALAIKEKALGPDHPLVANSLNNLANAHERLGTHEAAKVLHERALAIREKALGPNHPLVAYTLNNLASIHASTGAYMAAKALFERALAILEKALGPDHPDLASPLNNLANVHTSMGTYEEANELHKRTLAIFEKTLGPDHPHVAYPVTGLANVALAQIRLADAVALAERAVRVREVGNAPSEQLALSRFVLTQALWDVPVGQGRDRNRAFVLAQQARDAFREVKGMDKELAEVEAFLAKHGGKP